MPTQGGHLRNWRSGRDSPTSCGPRIRLQANPFDPRREPNYWLSPLPKNKCLLAQAFEIMAERTGLEPATPGVTGRYSNQLNYRSNRALAARERGELYPTVRPVSSSLALPSFDNRPLWRIQLLLVCPAALCGRADPFFGGDRSISLVSFRRLVNWRPVAAHCTSG